MALSNDLISQFVRMTNDKTDTTKETTIYGTAVIQNGKTYAQLDGADTLTPVTSTTKTSNGERVIVSIKNHSATITGNLSSPSVRFTDVTEFVDEISDFEIIIANKASIQELEVERGRIDNLQADNVVIRDKLTAAEGEIDILQSETITISNKLTASQAEIANLKTTKLDATVADMTYATIDDLKATDANIYNLKATYGDFVVTTTDKLEAIEADIEKLEAGEITVDQLKATFATIQDLNVERGRIDDLEVTVGDIDTLIFGSASGNVIQTSFANAVIAQLGNAQIKSAMIESLSASKITSGDIITNNVRVMSDDGKLLISDETIQIRDDTRVRVQIGKDSTGDYSINIWDADGILMFSEGGITESAIKEAIIRDDMVSDSANISAHKLNIASLFEVINGSTQTIKSSKILFDSKGQTLDVVFTDINTTIDELEEMVNSHGTQLSVVQGQISSKVWQQDITTAVDVVEKDIDTLSTKYTNLSQTVDGIDVIVASHTTELEGKAEESEVAEVRDQVTEIELSLNGFKSTVSNTYATKTDVGDLGDRMTSAETSINQNGESIKSVTSRTTANEKAISVLEQTTSGLTSKVSSVEKNAETALSNAANAQSAADEAQADIDNLEIGGRNLWRNGDFSHGIAHGDSIVRQGTFELIDLDGTDKTGFSKAIHSTALNSQIASNRFATTSEELIGKTLTLQCWIKYQNVTSGTNSWNSLNIGKYALVYTKEDGTTTSVYYGSMIRASVTGSSDGWVRMSGSLTFRDDVSSVELGTLWIGLETATEGEFWITGIKLEYGNKATDWTPAPDDIDSDIEDASNIANSAQETASNNSDQLKQAESIIQQLSDSISTLVVDESGESLMTQDGDRWLFSMGSFNETLNSVSSDLNTLTEDVGDTKNTVDVLNQAVNDLGVLKDYIAITTYNDQPCIELGEYDSDFKLRITNTEIQFVEGTSVPAYLSNQKLYITKAEITEELQQGEFVWKARSNGNLGLIWKGGNS